MGLTNDPNGFPLQAYYSLYIFAGRGQIDRILLITFTGENQFE